MSELKSFWKLDPDLDVPLDEYDKAVENLLFETYRDKSDSRVVKIYYVLKPVIARRLQVLLRRTRAKSSQSSFPLWPIEEKLERLKRQIVITCTKTRDEIPFVWFWPHGKAFSFVITHDVETQKGLGNIQRICEIERKYGFKSSWNFVPERYPVDVRLLEEIVDAGFEVGIHGLKHDGKLFSSRRVFDERMSKIEEYRSEWGAVGFRSPATHRNRDWMENMPFEYDSSFPDTDPYEPQPGGCLSVFPFFIGNLVELPITLAQDHTLFEILRCKDISIWKQKIDWIEKMNGMALVIVHPDYMRPGGGRGKDSGYPVEYYEELLQYVKNKDHCWHALPREMAQWWRERNASEITPDGNIEAPIRGLAFKHGVVARIRLVDNQVTFELDVRKDIKQKCL